MIPTYDSISGCVTAEDILAKVVEDLGKVDGDPSVVGHRRVVQSWQAGSVLHDQVPAKGRVLFAQDPGREGKHLKVEQFKSLEPTVSGKQHGPASLFMIVSYSKLLMLFLDIR